MNDLAKDDSVIGRSRLTPIGDAGYSNKFQQRMWKFSCACGNTIDLPRCRVFCKNPDVKSCGCWRRERMEEMHKSGKLDEVKWNPGEHGVTKGRYLTQLRMPDGRFAPKGYVSKRVFTFD